MPLPFANSIHGGKSGVQLPATTGSRVVSKSTARRLIREIAVGSARAVEEVPECELKIVLISVSFSVPLESMQFSPDCRPEEVLGGTR